jgi:hypothetical protein
MKKLIIFAILLSSTATFAVNDTSTTTTYNQPAGGSLTNTLDANASSHNNGAIFSTSAANGNSLDGTISNISRVDAANNQLGTSSVGNINNTSRGGEAYSDAYSNSGNNNLSNSNTNGQGQDQSMGQGQSSTNSNGQGQSSANTVSGGNTTVNGGTMTSTSTSTFKQASAPAIAPNVAVSGNNGVSLGVQTIAGGFSTGISRVDKSQKDLNKANAEYSRAAATGTLVESILKLEGCTSDVCKKAAALVLRKLGGK